MRPLPVSPIHRYLSQCRQIGFVAGATLALEHSKHVIAPPYSMQGLAIFSLQPPPLLQRDCRVVRQAHHEGLRSSQ